MNKLQASVDVEFQYNIKKIIRIICSYLMKISTIGRVEINYVIDVISCLA